MSIQQVLRQTSACNCANMRRAARAITKIYDKALEPSNLRATQFAALMYIKGDGPLNISALAKIMVLDRTTLVRNLKPLEAAGYIENIPTPDPRERRVQVTEEGRRVIGLALPHWKEVQRRMSEQIGRENLNILERIVTVLESSAIDNTEVSI